MADGFQPLTLAQIQTPDGISQLNNIIQTLYNNMAGDGVNVSTFYGTGSPEGVVTAGIGSIYLRTDGSTNTSLYRKESGLGNTGWVATSSVTVPISTANGGTGADNSAVAQGAILYFSATGVISVLSHGSSGQFLQSQGASANPQWINDNNTSNVVYSWSGQTDAAGSGTGVITGTSLGDTGTTTGQYLYIKDKNTSGTQTTIVLRTKFKKIAGISTLNIYSYSWVNGTATATAGTQLNVNGSTSNTSQTLSNSPVWVNDSGVDVSALTNGTVYDMSIAIRSLQVTGTTNGYLGSVVVLAS